MENETPEFEMPSASNKDMWLFLIVLDVIILCVLGFFLYNHFSAGVLKPAADQEIVAKVETTEIVEENAKSGDEVSAFTAKYMEGLDAFNQEDWAEAKAIWLEAEQLDPTNPDIKLALSKADEMLERAKLVSMPEEKQMAPAPQKEEAAVVEIVEEAPKVVPARKQSIVVTPVNGSKYRRVTFRWFEPAQKVAIVSGFTNRKPQALKKVGDYWETTLSIAPGTYKFLYIIDNKNTLDPYADQKDGRSLLVVK